MHASQKQAAPALDYEVIYRNAQEVSARELKLLAGAIPADLAGRLLRNGPGIFAIGGSDLVGFFDGCGLVAVVSFDAGKARLSARFVKTPTYLAEQQAGRQVRRRAFTNLPRGRNFMNLDLANPAMHDAIAFGGRIYATDDPGWWRLDPATLDTIGEDRWGRVPKLGKMAAVPRIDMKNGRLLAYWVKQVMFGADELRCVEIDRDWKIVSEVRHTLRYRLGFTHELAFSEHYFAVTELPVKLNLLAALGGGRSVFDCFQRTGAKPALHLVPRDPASERKALSVEIPGNHEAFFHLANVFERGDIVIADGVAYPWYDFAFFSPPALRPDALPAPTPVLYRFEIDLKSGACRARELARALELPRINQKWNGLDYSFAWLVANQHPTGGEPDPFVWAHELVKLDLKSGRCVTWDAGPHRFVSQPAFAARDGATAEDDGWVLVWLVNSESARAEIAILDGRSPEKGPIGLLDAGSYFSLASHCRFDSALA